ncbi:carboxypeptidase-like regulatory domain-containing protein, partial [Flavobacterium sp.]|uniref:carboxypeptidase-like regulatory domain-containing protein n=1 Tax=Flavobacterium sp. TaxID=239 RepID=UPI00286DECDA
MIKRIFVLIFLFMNCSLFSQIKGKVVDEKNQAIPFVNIAIENENIGTTSEENGEFIINESDKNKNLIFSALGYDKKIIKASENLQVVLKTSEIQLDEV